MRRWITDIHDGLPPHADTLPWTLEEVQRRLDRLQELACNSPYGLTFWDRSGLENLRVPGVGQDLARRLSVPEVTAHEKKFLLEAGQAIGAAELVPIAQRMIRDVDEDDRVRSTASYALLTIGNRDDFTDLADFVRAADPTTREQRVVVSNIIRGLIQHGLWGFRDAYLYAPGADLAIGDASSVLEVELKKRLTLEGARWLLGGFDWEQASDQRVRRDPTLRVHHTHHGPLSFALDAVELLLQQERLDRQDYDLLRKVVLARDDAALFGRLADKVAGVITADQDARRALFRAGLDQDSTGKRNWGWRWQWALTTDDVDWLADLAEEKGNTILWLWDYLLRLIHTPEVDTETSERIRERVHSHDTTVVADFDRRREEALEEQRRWEEEQARLLKEHEKPQYQLADILQDVLRAKNLTPQQTLHNLSRLCLVEDRFSPSNVIGRFEDLASEVQEQVVDACAASLRSIEPTTVPDGSSYPGTIMYESEAFVKVLQRREDYELDGDEIRKWLPAVLVSSVSDRVDTLARCIEADRVATEDVILNAIRREIRFDESGGHMAWSLPVEYWSGRLVAMAGKIVSDDGLPVSGRCNLLRVVAERSAEAAKPIAREWLQNTAGPDGDRKAMRLAAIDALLYSDPEGGMQELSRAVDEFGSDVLKQIGALAWRPGQQSTELKSWPSSALECLSVLLHRAFPPETDPADEPGVARWVGPTDDLRCLRDSIHPILFERANPDDRTTLVRLAEQFNDVHDWYAWAQANKDVLDLLPSKPAREGAVPWEDVVRLLDHACYRLIRDSADLQRVLVEELLEIEKTVKQHLAMLYYRLDKGQKHQQGWRRKRQQDEQRRRQDEDALQAYLHTRLSDRLPVRVLDPRTQVSLNREPLAALNRKFDLKVEAPALETERAVVVIEVKWSDHRDVSTSLRDQLGTRYLLANNLTHGIYLVGWVGPGRWRRTADGGRPRNRNSPQSWQTALERQAATFSAEHSSVSICPIVIDLRWENS